MAGIFILRPIIAMLNRKWLALPVLHPEVIPCSCIAMVVLFDLGEMHSDFNT